MAFELPAAVKPLVDLALHIVIGAVTFVIVFLVALGLAAFSHWVGTTAFGPKWLVTALEWVEEGLFGVDIVAAGLFLVRELTKFVKGLFSENQHG